MRIEHLTLKNFNGFGSCELEFNPKFNLLVGDNASGKTTVLDALSIAVDSWILGITGNEKAGGIDPDQVRVVAHRHEDSFSFEKQWPSRIEARGLVMRNQLTWARELSRKGGRTTYAEASNIFGAASGAARKVREGEDITLPLICSYGTERLWFETRHRKSKKKVEGINLLPSRLDGYRDCNSFEIQETELLKWIRAEFLAGLQRRQETVAFRAARDAITSCVESAATLYWDERYGDLVVTMEQLGQQLFKNLSDGQRIVLTLVGDLAKRAATLNPHLGDTVLEMTPGVVLIDELDLHLHPKWQRHVIRDLKKTFPAIQFIATTHSPQLIGEAQPEEIIRLGGQPPNPAQSFGMNSDWILKHVMGASERDPSVKAKLVEVEQLINDFKLDEARVKVDELRSEIGNDPDLVRFSARIDRFEKTR